MPMPVVPVLLVSAWMTLPSANETWNRFRGPGGAGVARDAAPLPEALDPEENLRWCAEVPAGHSSPCLTDELVFVTGAREGELATVCVARADGSVVWTRAVKPTALEQTHEVNGPASPTPATDGKLVVSYFGSFGLVAHDMAGKELWTRPLATPRNTFGSAASPILAEGKLVFLSHSEEGSFLEAFEPADGAVYVRTETKLRAFGG